MSEVAVNEIVIKKEELEELVLNKFSGAGVPEDHAKIVAEVLVHADLRGVHSHGSLRVEHYIKRLKEGGINPSPKFEFEQTALSTGRFNGDNGFGHVVAKYSMDEAIKMAKTAGVGVVVSYNSSHCGALSYYMEQATNEHLIGMAMTHTDSYVVPFGAKKPFLGTNPIAFGVPTKSYSPIILDMATSNVAMGKVLHAIEKGEKIPKDWGIDENGQPTDDPTKVSAYLPFGGPKGYGLGLMVDILSGILAGAAFGPHIQPMYGKYNEFRKLGHFFIAINPEYFTTKEQFLTNMDRLTEEIHSLEPAEGFTKVLLPGEPENLKSEQRITSGIPLPQSVYNYLVRS